MKRFLLRCGLAMTRLSGLRLAILFIFTLHLGLSAQQQQGNFDPEEAFASSAASAAKVSDTVWTQSGIPAWVSFSNPNAKIGDTVSVIYHFGIPTAPAENVNQVILTWDYDPRMVKVVGTIAERSSSWLVGDAQGNAAVNHDANAHRLEVKLWRTDPASTKSGAGIVARIDGGHVILDIDILKRSLGSVVAKVLTPSSNVACLQVTPNPVQDRIWIADECQGIASKSMVTITNLAGGVRFKGLIGETGHSVEAWPAGLYSIRFQDGGDFAQTKFLILRN